jgi:hypothetical protein
MPLHFSKPLLAAALSAMLAALCGCQQAAPVASAASAAIQPVASIQEVMQAFIDPSADAIWESVSTTITSKGVEEKKPQTDAEWQAIRLHAIRVIEGASLLQVSGRRVVQEGSKLEDAHVQGNAKLEDIVASLAKDPASFAAAARTLQTAAVAVLTAIDARDLPRIGETGAALDAACESCHLNYWYPKQVLPRWTPPKSLAAK